jgi:hypothetical protein
MVLSAGPHAEPKRNDPHTFRAEALYIRFCELWGFPSATVWVMDAGDIDYYYGKAKPSAAKTPPGEGFSFYHRQNYLPPVI